MESSYLHFRQFHKHPKVRAKVLAMTRVELPKIISTPTQCFAIEKQTLWPLWPAGKKQTNKHLSLLRSQGFLGISGPLSRFLFNGRMSQLFHFFLPLFLTNKLLLYYSHPAPTLPSKLFTELWMNVFILGLTLIPSAHLSFCIFIQWTRQ